MGPRQRRMTQWMTQWMTQLAHTVKPWAPALCLLPRTATSDHPSNPSVVHGSPRATWYRTTRLAASGWVWAVTSMEREMLYGTER